MVLGEPRYLTERWAAPGTGVVTRSGLSTALETASETGVTESGCGAGGR